MRARLPALFALTAFFVAGPTILQRAWGATLLHLSATAGVDVAADRLTATLRAEDRGADAAATQAAVNRLIGAAIKKAQAVKGVRVTTGAYDVWHLPAPDGRWEARQTLFLVGADALSLLALAGELQRQGLVIGGLQWSLSRKAEEGARARAMALAIGRLKAEAKEAAKLIGLRFDHFSEVTLDAESRPPRPMMLMATRAAAAPNALAGPERVRATVSAVAVLGED